MPFTSKIAYEAARIHAAAIYCSDGRIGAQCDDFLTNGLSLPRVDRVCLPGGPACLAGYPEATLAQQGVVDELHFLVEAHGLDRVILIAHQSCAFYGARLHLAESRFKLMQEADLVRAAAFVHQVTKVDNIEAYFARIDGTDLVFDPVRV